MAKIRIMGITSLLAAGVACAIMGCSKADLRNETIASANSDEIKVHELREFLGLRGGTVPASGVSVPQKKEALGKLIAGRLLAQAARKRGLDNTSEFASIVKENESGVLITALFRREIASKLKPTSGDLEAEAKKLRDADKNLSEDNAAMRAGRAVSEANVRKIEEDLVAAARKEFPPAVNQEMVGRIGKGEKVPEDAVLATVGADRITYGNVKGLLRRVAGGGPHGDQDLSANPVAVSRMVDREATSKALAAYARKQGIESTESMKSVRLEMERSILIDMLAEKEILKGVAVSDKEIGAAYVEHEKMFVRNGKKIPLSGVKDQIRQFLLNEKRKKEIEAYIEDLRKKAKISINEAMLPKV